MIFKIDAACCCSQGTSRRENEDNFFFKNKHLPLTHRGMRSPIAYSFDTEEPVLTAVFDGMGGEACGSEASYTASRVFEEAARQLEDTVIGGREFFIDACSKANIAINSLAASKQVNTMGTTVAALFFMQEEVFSCNVGDSRIYRIREGRVIQISEDHTDTRLLQSMGINKKPVLLQYLGMSADSRSVDPFISRGEMQRGDCYIACSDGVYELVSPAELYELSVSCGSASNIVKHIRDRVASYSNADNATVIVARVL